MSRGRKPKFIHLIRAMRPGDVIYLPESVARLGKTITSIVWRAGGAVLTACFVATNLNPESAHRVVRVTCRTPCKKKGTK